MKTTIKLFLLLALASLPSLAQVALTVVPQPSLTNSVFPINRYPIATVTGNGTAKFNIGSVSTITCRVTGTYTVASTALQVSNDNSNFTTIAWLPLGGGPGVTSIIANGIYQANVGGGLTQLQVNNTGTFTGTSQIFNCTGSATNAMDNASFDTLPGDPCQDKTIQKKSLPISGTAPSTVIAIPNVAGKTTFVCDFSVVVGTGATGVTVSAGTGATCGTGNIALTGSMPITPGQQLFFGWGGSTFGAPTIPASNDVCAAVAGGTATFGGYATFVQQ